jgi:hypothetical protein
MQRLMREEWRLSPGVSSGGVETLLKQRQTRVFLGPMCVRSMFQQQLAHVSFAGNRANRHWLETRTEVTDQHNWASVFLHIFLFSTRFDKRETTLVPDT